MGFLKPKKGEPIFNAGNRTNQIRNRGREMDEITEELFGTKKKKKKKIPDMFKEPPSNVHYR